MTSTCADAYSWTSPMSPTMRELVIILFRQGKLFVGVSGLVFVLVVVYAFAGETYRAHVRVLLCLGPRQHRGHAGVALAEESRPLVA